MIGLFLSRVNRHIRLPSITDIRAVKRIGAKPLPQCRKRQIRYQLRSIFGKRRPCNYAFRRNKINVGKAVGASGKDGKDGKDGIGIKSAKINDKGELVISYSDGNSVNLDKVVGETVNNGVGIASSIINEKGELVLTYTNGETANLGGVVGKDGRDGKNGADGKMAETARAERTV